MQLNLCLAFIFSICYWLEPKEARRTARPASCYDADYRCSSWAGRGECQRNPRYMLQYCKRSCGRCNTVNTGCVDNSQYCNDWSRRGECQRNPAYMKTNCRRSCGFCAVNGNWGSWGGWTTCTRSCGGGSQRRSRTCSNPAPKNGGRTCAGSSTQSRACYNSPCAVPVHGNWGAWSPWYCTKTCGGGIKYRRRTCSNPAPRNGGRQCQGNRQQTHTASCNVQGCPVDGKWGSWSKWSVCSKTCGGGYSKRIRTCSNPAPQNSGRTCQGTNQQTASCNTQQCPVDGQWSEWSQWTACSRSCSIGESLRIRYCNKPKPQNGGKVCVGNDEERRRCSLRICPTATSPPPATPSPLFCGRPKKSRIVGGEIASNRDWPWQVGLQAMDDDFIFCGGSLIDHEWVLTAAHCIYRNKPSRKGCVAPSPGLRVILGEFDVLNIDGHEVQKTISQVCMHPSYDHSIYDNDIALLRMSSPLQAYNDTMIPVCLPSSKTNFPPGTNCSVTGWGKTHQSGWVSNKLRVAQVPIIDHTTCKDQYLQRTGDIVTDRMICAGYQAGKIDSCKGDSGGPFVCKERGRYVLVGATSWGVGCAQAGQPGVYTDIKDFLSWIESVISPEP